MGSFSETYPLRPGSNLRSGFFFSFPLVSKTKREERPPDRRLAWFRPPLGSLCCVLYSDSASFYLGV